MVHPLTLPDYVDDLQQRFTEQPVVRAHFDQTRTIKDLPQPLRSQGKMLIARDQGLLWDQTAPFPMQLLLDDKRMVQVINGQPPQTITAENKTDRSLPSVSVQLRRGLGIVQDITKSVVDGSLDLVGEFFGLPRVLGLG